MAKKSLQDILREAAAIASGGLEERESRAEMGLDGQDYDPVYGSVNQAGIDAMNLQELMARVKLGNPFKPGDLVTPRRGYNIRGAGYPCIVMEVFEAVITPEKDKHGDGLYHMNDMRIARIVHSDGASDTVTFLAESFTYELYSGPIMSVDAEKVH